MFRSISSDVFNKYENILNNSITRFRDFKNYNQYLWSLYAFYHGRAIKNDNFTHMVKNFESKNIQEIINQLSLNNKDRVQQICINDNKYFNETTYQTILNKLKELYPNKSKYENILINNNKIFYDK